MNKNKAAYLYAAFEPRYWEDSRFTECDLSAWRDVADDENGVMVPHRNGNVVCWWIDLQTGKILNWPSNIAQAWIHYKVCDQGRYYLADSTLSVFARWRDHYVPDKFLCHGDEGFGDYIIFKVENGVIQDYTFPQINDQYWEPFENESPELEKLRAENAELRKQVTTSERFRREDSYDAEQRMTELRSENAELRAKLGGDWIPVTDDKKPERGQEIVVTYKGSYDSLRVGVECFVGFFDVNTIAWMPRHMPEPYNPRATQ